MPTLDTSVIADIGSNTLDASGAQGKALTLADLYNTNQLDKGKLTAQKQQAEDMTYAKQILAGKDLSKLEDQNAAVAKITQRSPQLGMELMRGFQGQRAGDTDEALAQLKLHDAKNDIMGSALYQLKVKHDDLIAKGGNEQAVDQGMRQDMFATLQQLRDAKLPNGQPVLNDQDLAFAKNAFKDGYNPGAVDTLVQRSTQAKAAIAAKFKELDEQRKDRNEGRLEKATDAAITKGVRSGDQADRKISDAEQRDKAKKTLSDGGKLTDDDSQALAEQYLAGDKSVLQGLGRGAQGAENIIAVRHAIAKEAKSQGMQPADIAARLAEYQGYAAEQRSLGTRSANIETAATEAYNMIDVAKAASKDVPRSNFLPWSKIVDVKGDVITNDPKYAKFAAATLAVVNTWARAISPTGTPTVADKEHANSVLNTAQSPEAYDAVLDQFKQEIKQSLDAPPAVKQSLHDRFVGQAGGGASGPRGAATIPTPAPAAATGGNQVYHFDANGNMVQGQ